MVVQLPYGNKFGFRWVRLSVGLALMLGSACSQASHVAQVKEAGEEREAIAHISSTAANKVTMWTEGDIRYIRANGVPDHAHGQFPNAGNPNQITAQDYTFAMTLNPSLASTTTERGGIFGIALNGVPFDPGTAEYWNNGQRTHQRSDWRYEALSGHLDLGLDNNNAHVQPTGAYHYHGIPTGLVELLNGEQFTGLVGYAADGFPIYVVSTVSPSYRIKSGQRSSGPGGTYDGTFVADYEYVEGLGDLDECNGRVGTTPDYPNGTYHYYLTSTFPFIPRCWKGSPDDSFARSAPESGQHPGGQPGAGRPRQRTGLPPFPPHRRPNHR